MIQPKEFEVIYLTGAPATGKSTLVEYLLQHVTQLEDFTYSKVLAEYVSKRDRQEITQDGLRHESSRRISAEDVNIVDSMLLDFVNNRRTQNHIIVDSHAVTKEEFGYRVTPFSLAMIERIRPTLIYVLYAESSIVRDRIKAKSQGRPLITPFEADFHVQLQASVALTYGIHLGIPVYFLDSSVATEQLAFNITQRLSTE